MASGLFLKRLLALPLAEVLAVVEAMNWEEGLVGDQEKAWPGDCVMTQLAASECGRARACRGRLTAAQMQPEALSSLFPTLHASRRGRNDALRRRHGASRNSGHGSAPFLACWPHRNADVEGGRPGEPEHPGARR
ncbi:hypothetical protein EV291_12258 [Rhizobium sp. BK068]|nr:hypothetical protein EV291_12258 [Rhizobium sp. BK068]